MDASRRRRALVRVTGQAMVQLCKGRVGDYTHLRLFRNPLPADAVLLSIAADPMTNSVVLLLESVSFPLVYPGDPIDILPETLFECVDPADTVVKA